MSTVWFLYSVCHMNNLSSSSLPFPCSDPSSLSIQYLLGTYFNAIMFMVASSVVTTIMVLNYHHRLVETHEMPDWVKIIFLQWAPWLLRMNRPGVKITRKTIQVRTPTSSSQYTLVLCRSRRK